MAAEAISEEKPKSNPKPKPAIEDSSSFSSTNPSALLSSYLGLSFAVFLGFLPKSSVSYVASLQSRNRILSLKLFQAEDQLKNLRSRRKEDSKANARVVEIFASHRNAWQQEEKRLLHQIDASAEEIAGLRARIEELERSEAELRVSVERLEKEVSEREEMIDFMARRTEGEEFEEEKEYCGDFSGFGKDRASEGLDRGSEACFLERKAELDELVAEYARENGFGRDFVPPVAECTRGMERSGGWQDIPHDSIEPMYHIKNFVARRESPWKVDGDSSGVSSKLKLLEQELTNLEKLGKGNFSKVPSLMRKQAKRYQSLAGKIDDLCRRMQISDPLEATLSPEFRTQRQTEFLLEAFRLQHRATETRQKLSSLQAEAAKSHTGDEVAGQVKVSTRRSMDSIRNNFKEIQRNLEIWLARIMGDLEGILARDGASRVRDYYTSGYPFVQ